MASLRGLAFPTTAVVTYCLADVLEGAYGKPRSTPLGSAVTLPPIGERLRPDLGTNVIAEYDNFQVHAVAKGIPIYDSKSMWVNLYPSGAGYYHWMS